MRNNKYENVEIKSLYDIEDLIELINDELIGLSEDEDIVVYAKRDLISELFTELIKNDFDFLYVNFDKIDDMIADEVYIMTITGDYRIGIEKAYINKKFVQADASTVFFYMDDCKQDIIDYCIGEDIDVILFDFECDNGYTEDKRCDKCITRKCDKHYNKCDCYDDCEKREDSDGKYEDLYDYTSNSNSVVVSKSKDGTPNGFTKSWYTDRDNQFSSYTYSFQCDNLDIVKKVAKDFGIRL